MWIATTQGFYSVVEDRADPDRLLVRARTAGDIEALRGQIPSLEPFEDPGADYRHRALVRREQWIAALALLAADIDYDNFKNAVAERQDHERAGIYAGVWSALLTLQRG